MKNYLIVTTALLLLCSCRGSNPERTEAVQLAKYISGDCKTYMQNLDGQAMQSMNALQQWVSYVGLAGTFGEGRQNAEKAQEFYDRMRYLEGQIAVQRTILEKLPPFKTAYPQTVRSQILQSWQQREGVYASIGRLAAEAARRFPEFNGNWAGTYPGEVSQIKNMLGSQPSLANQIDAAIAELRTKYSITDAELAEK